MGIGRDGGDVHLVVDLEGRKWSWALSKASDESVPSEDVWL